jgi:hypothetical protein
MTSNSSKLIQEHKQVRKQKEHDFRPVTFYVDWKAANFEFYQKHGVVTSEILYKNKNQIKSIKEKGYFHFEPRDISETEAFRRTLSLSEVALPHPEVFYRINQAVDNFNKFEATGDFGELKLVNEQESHEGFTHYWKFMSNKKHVVKVGDVVQFGLNFRNGIGTLTSLGGDFYSHRLWCANGAIARDKAFSFSIPHRISAERMLEKLVDSLTDIFQNYKQLLNYYREFTKVKLTQIMALQIIKKAEIPLKYLSPRLFDVTMPDEDNELKHALIKLSKHGKESTLWDLFNSITQPLTRSANDLISRPTNKDSLFVQSTDKLGKIVYASFVERTSALHRAMFPLVEVPQIEVSQRSRRN